MPRRSITESWFRICLDVAEIFFTYRGVAVIRSEVLQWSTGIRVVAGELDIDPVSDLGKLLNGSAAGAGSGAFGSAAAKHRLLGETLKMYLFQDHAVRSILRISNTVIC